jgi:hypothetical protein
MAQLFNNAVMTDNGAALLTKAAAGQITIEFTYMAVGNGSYSDGEKAVSSLQKRVALKAQKNTYPISDVTAYTSTCVRMTAIISNYDSVAQKALVTTGYYINEIGMFAKAKGAADSTAVLYSIAVVSGTQGDYMPPYNGYNPAQIVQQYLATVNATTDITINTAGAAALKDDFDELKSNVEADESRLADAYTAEQIMMFRQIQEGYENQAEVHTVDLSMTSNAWPFNNTETTVALSTLRETTGYGVDISVISYSGGRLGNITAAGRALNGFKLIHDGSATAVRVCVRVTGGMTA